jgi:hypothetical protein
MRIINGAYVGIGVTPLNTIYQTIQFPGEVIIGCNLYNASLSKNLYYNAGWKFYSAASAAALCDVGAGDFNWYSTGTGTGTAGGAASVTTFMSIDNTAVLKFNSGYGSAAKAYGCRAWARITGGGGSGGLPATGIDAGGNASSLTRNSTGNYTLNFTTSMPDTNYAFSGNQETGNVTFDCLITSYNQYTTGVNFITLNNGTQNDFRYGSLAIFR